MILFVVHLILFTDSFQGNVYTDFIPDFQSELFAVTSPAKESIIEAAVGSFLSNTSLVSDGEATPFQVAHDFRVNLPSARTFQLGMFLIHNPFKPFASSCLCVLPVLFTFLNMVF